MDMISFGAFQFKPEFQFRITLKAREPTWPVYRTSKVTKAREWSGFSQHKTSRDHDMPTVARSVLDSLVWLDRRNGTCAINKRPAMRPVTLNFTLADVGDIDTISGSPNREVSTPLMLDDIVNLEHSLIPELCSVAA